MKQKSMFRKSVARHLHGCGLSALVVAITGLLSSPAFADTTAAPAPPSLATSDSLGVDLMSQAVTSSINDVSIGSGLGELSHIVRISGPELFPFALTDNYVGGLSGSGPFTRADGTTWTNFSNPQILDNGGGIPIGGVSLAPACPYQISIGSFNDCFWDDGTGNGLKPIKADGSTLTFSGGFYTYTNRNGTKVIIQPAAGPSNYGATVGGYATQVIFPSGLTVNINWDTVAGLVRSVTNNFGYMLKYNYITVGSYQYLKSVTAINTAIDYCDPLAVTCTLSHPWHVSDYSWSTPCTLPSSTPNNSCQTFTVTDQAGAATRYTLDTSNRITAIKPATSSTDQYTFTYCKDLAGSGVNCVENGGTLMETPGNVDPSTLPNPPYYSPPQYTLNLIAATKEGRTWTYAYNSGGGSTGVNGFTNKSTDPDGRQEINLGWATFTYSLNPKTTSGTPPALGTVTVLNGSETFQFDNALTGRLQSYTGHGYTENYTYDARGNTITATKVAPANSGFSNIVRQASYDTTCLNIVTCNQPNTITDGNNHTTQFTYDGAHGGLLTVTMPSDQHGVQAQVRYSYAQRYAYYLNSSGSLVASPNPVWVLTQESRCRTGAPSASGVGCSIAGDETRKTYIYGADGVANNLLLRGVVDDSEPGGRAATTCYAYDINGNMISKTMPNAGLTTCS